MRLVNIACTFATFLVICGQASATVIDFQSLEHIDGTTAEHGTTYTEDGFTLTEGPNDTFAFVTFGTQEGRFSGSTALFNNTVGGVQTLVRTTGGLFDLFSIDLAELNSSSNTSVTFTNNDGETQTFTLDGIAFGAEKFSFNLDFLGISSVSWVQESPFHQFDNICLDDPTCSGRNGNTVPEPSTLALLGIAGVIMAGHGVRRSRRPARKFANPVMQG